MRLYGLRAAKSACADCGRTLARQPVALAVVTLVLLGVALRLWLILRGWPDLDSDEAIVGLMGRHILYAGERPVFYYGQHYQGAVDGYLTAAIFAVLGPTTLAFRVLLLLLTIPMLLASYALGRAAYGTAVGLLTLAYLVVGPAFALLTEVGDLGGWHDDAVLGPALCLLVYAELRRVPAVTGARGRWRAAARYALMGALAGLGLWSDQLMLPLVAAALLALALARPRALRQLPAAGLALGLVVGALPLLIANIQNPGVTWLELARQSADAHVRGLLPALGAYAGQLGQTLAVGMPAVLGSPHVCISQGGTWHNYPPVLAATGAAGVVCGGLNTLFAVGVLGCFGVVAWQLGRIAWRWAVLVLARRTRREGAVAAGQGVRQRAYIPTPLRNERNEGNEREAGRAYIRTPLRSRRGEREQGRADSRGAAASSRIERGGGTTGSERRSAVQAQGQPRTARATDRAMEGRGGGPRRAEGEWVAQERAARLWLRAILLLTGVGTLVLYTLSRPSFSNSFTAARYLLPLYAALPLVFGVLWEGAAPMVVAVGAWWAVAIQQARRNRRQSQRVSTRHDGSDNGLAELNATANREQARGRADHFPRSSGHDASLITAALASAGLILLLGFAVYGSGATLRYAGDGTRYALPAPPRDQQLLAALEAHGITRYISDYWTCYRLVFESGERLRCGVRDGVNNTLTHNGAVNRYLPYLLEVERTPHPAYIFDAGSAWDSGFASWAASQRLPRAGYARFVAAGYAIYYFPAGQG